MKKRILSMLLVAIMLLTLMPVTTFANNEGMEPNPVAAILERIEALPSFSDFPNMTKGELQAVLDEVEAIFTLIDALPPEQQDQIDYSALWAMYEAQDYLDSAPEANSSDIKVSPTSLVLSVGETQEITIRNRTTDTIHCRCEADPYGLFTINNNFVETITLHEEESVKISVRGVNGGNGSIKINNGAEVIEIVSVIVIPAQHTHSFAETWSYNESGHWHECTAGGCDIESYATCGETGAAYAVHDFSKGDCACGAKKPAPSYTITNGTPESAKETNHGYIAIDKTTASEGDPVTVTVKPADGYKLKSLTAVPEAKTISTIADVLATVEGGFPEGTGMKNPPNNAWVCGSDRYTFVIQSGQNSALIFYYSEYIDPSNGQVIGNATYVLTTTEVIAGENCYTATSGNNTLTFNMTDGKLTGIAFSSTNENTQNNYGGTYTSSAITPADSETITPEKQTDVTYQFTMPAYAVTVKAEFEEAPAHTHGTGTEAVTFEKEIKTFADLQDLFTNGGSGYMANDIECTAGLTVAANVNLCLNDKVLNLAGKGNVTVSEGKTFNLYDCGTTVRYYDKDGSTGLWTLNVAKTSGDHTTKGGIVTGGTTNGNGAGILVYGTFTLDGGNIVGNKATMSAGGVLNDKGTFTMTGGTIVGNTAAGNGGGVYVNKGTFTMTGGEISGNTASNSGGGAYMTGSQAEFGMSGGTISGNTASNGGGVYSSGDTFSMTDGTISGNTAKTGGGVYSGSKFTMSGGEIKDNTATSGGGVYSSGKFSMTGGTISGNTTTGNGGGAYMTGSQAEFGMSGGMISGNTASNGGGGVYVNGCKFLMSGGTISGNTATANGGGAYMTGSKAEFGMSGGTISGNTATANGGGVYSGSKFMMSGGTIFDNKAGTGGGVYFYGSNTFTMSGGTISGNTATANGGVYMSGTIILGGTAKITDNTAGAEGSKVTNNLYLPTGKTVTFGTGNGEGGNGVAAPATGFAVGVTTETAPANGTPVQITTNGATTDTSYFTPDNDAYEVKFNANHLELAVKHTHAPVLVNGQAATETAAGFKDYYKCDCGDSFEDATCKVEITDLNAWKAEGGAGYIAKLEHIHAPVLVNGQAATKETAGWKDYYKCDCGKFFEDATCKVEITDLAKWKAEGGNGYIAKLEEEPKSPQTGDNSHMTLWVMLLALSSMGLCACLVLGKKRKNEQ